MGSSTSGTIVGTLLGFIATLGIGYGVLYIVSINLLPLVGPGLVAPYVSTVFQGSTILEQLFIIYNDFLLFITYAYILAPVIWLIGGLLGGLIVRDMIKGAAAGLLAAIIAPFVCFGLSYALTFTIDFNLLLNWVINGLLAGLIAAVGGVIGGTLTSQFEAH